MRVRRAGPEDAERIAEIHVRSWQHGYRGLLPDAVLDALTPALRLPQWRTILGRPGTPGDETLVVEDAPGGLPLGFATLHPEDEPAPERSAAGEIAGFYLLPEAWGRGVGRRLMTACLASFGDAGYQRATLRVLATNARAIRFYRRCGWYTDGVLEQDTMAGTPIRSVRYHRDLR